MSNLERLPDVYVGQGFYRVEPSITESNNTPPCCARAMFVPGRDLIVLSYIRNMCTNLTLSESKYVFFGGLSGRRALAVQLNILNV